MYRSGMVLFTIVLGMFMVSSAVQSQTTWYVDDNAPNDPGPGDPTVSDPAEDGSAAHPFDAILEAIDTAVADDTVLLLDGTYSGEGNQDLELGGKSITLRSANGPSACEIDPDWGSRGFILHQGENQQTVLEGLTISGGRSANGGNLLIQSCSPTIRDCVISYGSADQDGGGICCRGTASPLITDCTIKNNYADDYGGGIYCGGTAAPRIENCTIQTNQGFNCGGGINCEDDSAPVITNCLISGNYCEDFANGGGIAVTGNARPLIEDCTITENHIGLWNYNNGGGIYWSGSVSPTLLNCVITDNETTGISSRGGGIYCASTSETLPVVKDCIISGNFSLGDGGGIYCRDDTLFTNCLISGNTTEWYVGGIEINGGSPTMTNCTIAGNSATEPGGGIYGFQSSPTVTNCIVWGNSPDNYVFYDSTPTISYSDVQGGFTGDGNINSPPLFITGPNGGHYLSQLAAGQLADSPCLDAGNPSSPLVDGTTRTDEIKDSGTVDMGYHYPVQGTVDAFFNCSPSTGPLPFTSRMTVALINRIPDAARRIAARIDIQMAGGQSIPGWRTGFSNVDAGEIYFATWPQAIPALGSLIGNNLFQLVAEDVTPAPYNQPPYQPAGDTAFDNCVIEGN